VYVLQAWRMEIRRSDWLTRRRIVRTPGLGYNGDTTFGLADEEAECTYSRPGL